MTEMEEILAKTGIVEVAKDDGESFWNRYYLERFHKMATRLRCFRQLDKRIFSQVIQVLEAQILEMGCGSGRNVANILKHMRVSENGGKIYAIDISHDSLNLAREELGNPENVVFQKDNMRRLSFEDNKFDAVFDVFAGCYMPHRGWQLGVKEAFRVMRSGGYGYFLYFVHDKKFASCFRSQVPIEFALHPVGLFWALHLKLIRGLNVWDKFIEKGDVIYPTHDEFVELVEQNGGLIKVAEKTFLDACVFVKAQKQ